MKIPRTPAAKKAPAAGAIQILLAPIVRAEPLGDQAYASVREALACGALPPGHRLTVRGLVDLLGIGFTPAREALNRLAPEGCQDTGPRGGSMVPSRPAAWASAP